MYFFYRNTQVKFEFCSFFTIDVVAKIYYRDRMVLVVGFTTTYAINVYHHYRCELEARS